MGSEDKKISRGQSSTDSQRRQHATMPTDKDDDSKERKNTQKRPRCQEGKNKERKKDTDHIFREDV
jgi:hypothetical protein